MPLVKRLIEQNNDTTTFRKATVPHVLYVPPGKVLRGDEVVEPDSREQLAELAFKYPDEFGELAKKKGVVAGVQTADNVRMLEIMAQPMKELLKTITGLDADEDEALLWSIFEYETGDNGERRKPVLAALAKHGVEDDPEAEAEE